jgi:2-polyprenyl-6-methoxyphenol hydroxylase-like FAD-dependent oxidoreductase
MSPVGGVGINLAIQDAVAAANILAGALTQNKVTTNDLAKVQKRRLLPTRLTQGVQVFIQNRVLGPVLGTNQQISVPWFLRLFRHWPFLRRIPARIVGIGFRPEHIETKDAFTIQS